MTTTENYGLKKPDGNDYVAIDVINENMDTIDQELKNQSDHASSKSNPHGVTKSQVGLGNVPNVATNDQTPTYTQASTLATLVSGEKLSVSMGKIMKAITDLIGHLANESNPHGVTAAQAGAVPTTRTVNGKALNLNISLSASDVGAAASSHTHTASDVGAAPTAHQHAAADISSGTLGVARGGTGTATFASGAALIGNGTNAVGTRAITNLTAKAAVTGSTNLATANTVLYHAQNRLNRTTAVNAADTNYTTYMGRAIALVTAAPSSLTNGCCAFVYE